LLTINRSWVGFSPYLEMAQFESTVLVYCVIPPEQPYRSSHIHLSSPGKDETIVSSEAHKAYFARYKAKEGMIYAGIIPLHYTGKNLQESGFNNMERIVDDGSEYDGHTGYVVEMAHSSECSFEEFKNRVNASAMKWDKDKASLSYTNRKGHLISLTHSSRTNRKDKLPAIKIKPYGEEKVSVDWERYPAIRSPYMRIIQEDGREKLVINDNKGGVKIDFDGDRVHYIECNDYLPVDIKTSND